MKKLFLLLLLPLIGHLPAQAQNPDFFADTSAYTLQIGLFSVPPAAERFKGLEEIGNFRSVRAANGRFRALIGHYAERTAAADALKIAESKGFQPFIQRIADILPPDDEPPALGKELYSLQLGAFRSRKSAPDYRKVTQLAEANDLLAGIYTLIDTARDLTSYRFGDFSNLDTAKLYAEHLRKIGFKTLLKIADVPPSRAGKFFRTPSYYKRMEGVLNNRFKIVVHMYFKESSVNGFFNDPRTGTHCRFRFYDKKGSKLSAAFSSARFSGKNTDYALDLEVQDTDSREKLNFSLTEKYPAGSARFEIVSAFRQQMSAGSQTGNEMGTDMYVEYPVMRQALNKKLEDYFNSLSAQLPGVSDRQSLYEKLDDRLRDDLLKVKSHYPQYRWLSQTYETKIMENSEYLISARFFREHILEGAEARSEFKSFNLQSGTELTIAGEFSRNFGGVLRSRLTELLLVGPYRGKAAGSELEKTLAEMMQNYYFTISGIVFYREFKEDFVVGPAVQLTVPYTEISDYLKADSFLRRFL